MTHHKYPNLHQKWYTMVNRCHGNHRNENMYQKNGIKVCNEWRGEDGYERFEAWSLSHGYSPDLVIDRIDTRGDYCPENCRYISQKENNRNKVNTVFVYIDGDKRCLSELSDSLLSGCSRKRLYNRIYARIRRGRDKIAASTFSMEDIEKMISLNPK